MKASVSDIVTLTLRIANDPAFAQDLLAILIIKDPDTALQLSGLGGGYTVGEYTIPRAALKELQEYVDKSAVSPFVDAVKWLRNRFSWNLKNAKDVADELRDRGLIQFPS